jgi:hypothetical protein
VTSVYTPARSAYLAGLIVLPAAEDGSKRPAVSSWREFQQRRPSVDEIRGFDFAHRAGFGVVGGPVSGNLDPWDFDCPATFAAFVERAADCALADVVARIRAGFEAQTPSGGVRWLVRYPADLPFQDVVLARRPGRDGEPKTKTLIEITLFSVLPPSNGGTHPSGRPYVQVSGDFTTIPAVTADERAALFDLARSFDAMPRREYQPAAKNAGKVGTRPGDEFNRRMSWPEILEPHEWTRVGERGDVTWWRRPGKAIGVSATTNHAGSDLFFSFTSSTEFEADKSYSKFGAYAVLQHGGDFAAAAAALAEQGYGAPRQDRARRERPAEPAPSSASAPVWRWLKDVEREYVEWHWPGRLARGTLTLVVGDPGRGKSTAIRDVIARTTIGAAWPDGGIAPIGNVAILSAEDAASYTIRPGIEAAGGDVSRVVVLDAVRDGQGTERVFRLDTDLPALEALIEQVRPVLVHIDPVSAYWGTRLDSYRDSDVRSVLAPLVALAERHRVAMLGTMHVGKSSDRQARHRVLGSIAFVAAARFVFAVGPDPEDETRRIFATVKSNLAKEAPALAFTLEDAGGVARAVWEAAPVPGIDADTVLAGKATPDQEDQSDAEHVIRGLLDGDDWPLEAGRALDAGKAHGIHERTMRRTARRLGIDIRRIGFGKSGRWLWHRPTEAGPIADTPAAEDTAEAPSTSAVDTGHPIADTSLESVSVSPMGSVSPMPTIGDSSTHRGHTNTLPARARESVRYGGDGDDLPACLAELTEPDLSDPIGEHDLEAPAAARPDPWQGIPRPPGSDAAAAAVETLRAAGRLPGQTRGRRRP